MLTLTQTWRRWTWRRWTIWLLMLALPVQGVAAATMLYCGKAPQKGAVVANGVAGESVVHAHATPTMADHGLSSGGHGFHHGHSAAEGANLPDKPASAAGGADQTTGCSVCAQGCYAAVIVSSSTWVPRVLVSLAPVSSPPGFAVSFFTDGPRRPPRFIFA